MAGFWTRLFGRGPAQAPLGGTGPSAEARKAARETLALSARSASVFRVGGARPPASRAASWWGGNFVAEPPGPGLVPLVQLRATDLPKLHRNLIGADYLLVWLDPDIMGAEALAIETHAAPDPASLLPPERACRMAGALATLPLLPGQSGIQLPSWEDFAGKLPRAVAEATDDSWFFDAPQIAPEDEEPVIIGGWPQWIQGTQWPDGGSFVMEIRSTGKGRLSIGDGGSFYVFRVGEDFVVRTDFY